MNDKNLETMLTAYIAAALWSTAAPEELGIENLDEMFKPEHFTEEAMRRCRLDCAAFLDYALHGTDGCLPEGEFKPLLNVNTVDFSQVGHDFWLTREGHGVGFWDRPEVYGDDEAEELTALCKRFGEVYLEAYIDEVAGLPASTSTRGRSPSTRKRSTRRPSMREMSRCGSAPTTSSAGRTRATGSSSPPSSARWGARSAC